MNKANFNKKQTIFHFPKFKALLFFFKVTIWQTSTFILLLLIYLVSKVISAVANFRFFPKRIRELLKPSFNSFYTLSIKILDLHKEGSISRINLIDLSIRNMKVKKARTIVTVGGMTLGIGIIVFLVSIGYGLQQVVISRVARLEEMRQADIAVSPGGKLKINDKTLADFNNLANIDMVLPLISVVGRVNYKNSISDMAVYGVTKDYLKQSAIKPSVGKIFESNELFSKIKENKGKVAGESTKKKIVKYGEKIKDIEFSIDTNEWIRIREKPDINSKILGYTKRTSEVLIGQEYWGGMYESDDGQGEAGKDKAGKTLGKWIKASVFLWEEKACDRESGDCEFGKYVVLRDKDGSQIQSKGYFAEINGEYLVEAPDVLGVSDREDDIGKSSAKYNEKIQDIDFSIYESFWIRIREKPNTNSKILGYTKKSEGISSGQEYWGGMYESDDGQGEAGKDKAGKTLGKWIKASVFLWEEKICDRESGDCEFGKYVVLRDKDDSQIQKQGYFAEINVSITSMNIKKPDVLGISTENDATDEASNKISSTTDDSFNNEASDEAFLDWVEIASEAGVIKPPETKKVKIGASAKRQAVVNRAMLRVLGINEKEAVGKKFKTSFVIISDLLEEDDEKIESVLAEYTIVGVIPDDKTPVFYVPFMDIRTLGVTNYSQVKILAKHKSNLDKIRKQIEAMGYSTSSVVDTVEQINNLFSTIRTFLALLGMVALAVASLGMFNTLTVSLLERTREVGLMKAMGMKSSEVQELFLTESMVMGFLGGLFGIALGFIMGKAVGLFLSLFALFKGVGLIDISYLPPLFVIVIILISLIVGIVTGIYPARRATKISALDALRYE